MVRKDETISCSIMTLKIESRFGTFSVFFTVFAGPLVAARVDLFTVFVGPLVAARVDLPFCFSAGEVARGDVLFCLSAGGMAPLALR